MAGNATGWRWRAVHFRAVVAILVAPLVACGDQGQVPQGRAAEDPPATEPHKGPLVASSSSTSSEGWNQIVTNPEYGIRAVFPDGLVVCEVRSWEHPYGFSALLTQGLDCDSRTINGILRRILVTAYYNATDMTSARSGLPCENGSLPPGIELDLGDLALDDRESFACAMLDQGGGIRVVVAALGGEGHEHAPPEPRIPRVEYHASLFTSPDHLSEDYHLFREFLERFELLPLE